LEGATGITAGGGIPSLGDRLNVALPVTDALGSSIGFSILRPNILLDLELSALQVEGRGEIISSPRVITANGQKATISQGEEIPFLSIDQGTSNVEFRDALLLTEVTPQITPNGNVIMDIKVTKNEVNFQRTVQGNPTISKREVETQVVVGNGETVVLGGVYEITSLEQLQSVPFFGELPFLKHLFRNTVNSSNKAELLIFVTPRVLD
jgi:type IV pilus assembly protein PilQ